ncbi:MAG: B12-binding domain-containing radical SAM protein [Gracilibacteraceae bacterium]|nr:B12-binding domain-containing radical SAM protein [Gracilibacteraceae bacterium]
MAALTPEEHYIRIVDETLNERVDFDGDWDLIGLSMMTTQASRCYKIADEFRRRGIKVVAGGYHASVLPDEALRHCDAVCIGEGEKVWQQMLIDAERGNLKQRYFADTLTDLKDVPWPKRSLVRDKRFGVKNFVQTTRGCPNQCSFCTIIKFFGHTYRLRPVDDVIEEIKYLKRTRQLKWNTVFFSDDNICGDPEYARELFTKLIPLKVNWGSQCFINIAKDEGLVELARESGCKALAIGLESLSVSSLQQANKNAGTVEWYSQAIKMLHKHKIAVFGLFIFGFDADEKNVFEDTKKFVEDNCLEYAMFSVLTPMPGTIFYTQYKENGRLLHENWADYDFQHVVFTPKNMTAQELQDGRYNTAKSIHTWRSIFKRIVGAKSNFWFPLLMNIGLKRLYHHLPKI